MANTEDLRYMRTEASIRSAFLELVGEMPVKSVTASAVCRRAGISRNAFYLHYAGVQGLYASLVDELVGDVLAESAASAERVIAAGVGDHALSPSLLAVLSRHEGMLRALLPSDDGTLAKTLAEGIEGAFVEAAQRISELGGGREHRLRCSYTAWAIVGFVSRWISMTDLPVTEALPTFEELHESGMLASTRHMLEGVPIGT